MIVYGVCVISHDAHKGHLVNILPVQNHYQKLQLCFVILPINFFATTHQVLNSI